MKKEHDIGREKKLPLVNHVPGRITIIAAVTPSLVIGKDGSLPWHITGDLQWFSRNTRGHIVVMGRKTCQELNYVASHYKPLKNRVNIILSKFTPWWNIVWSQKVEDLYVCNHLSGVRAIANSTQPMKSKEIFIIGGAEIYRTFLAANIVNRMLLTKINKEYEGDIKFPMGYTNPKLWDVEKIYESERFNIEEWLKK